MDRHNRCLAGVKRDRMDFQTGLMAITVHTVIPAPMDIQGPMVTRDLTAIRGPTVTPVHTVTRALMDTRALMGIRALTVIHRSDQITTPIRRMHPHSERGSTICS